LISITGFDNDANKNNMIGYGQRITDLARENPMRIALVIANNDSITEISISELERRGNQLARYYHGRGIKQGDIVSIPLPNSVELIAAMLGAWKIGAIPNPLSSSMPPDELKHVIDCAQSAFVVSMKDLEASTVCDNSPLPALTEHSGERALASGGSTGKPKLILPKDRAVFNPQLVSGLFKPEKTALVAGPIYHAVPFSSTWQAIFNACTAVVMKKFDAERCLQLIAQYRVDRVWFVPTMMLRIWRLPEDVRKKYDVSSLKHVLSGGAPMPAWLMQCWIDWLGAEKMYDVFGPSERIGGTMINGVEWLQHMGSVGKPLPYAKLKILDEQGNECAPGVMGEIYTLPQSGAGSTYDYRGATASAKRTHDGWETVGDMGYLDKDGYLYLGDRKSDMILSKGRNIYPAEVEAAIQEFVGVRTCAVIGLPDEDGGNRIHAIIDTEGRILDIEALKSFLKSKLTPYKIPASLELVNELLRNDAGKVRRSALRDERVKP
jgi:bile acid-coenzyme A ligase